MKHRILSLLLAMLLIVTLLPGAVSAADTGKVRVIVENTAMREDTYQGFQVPWKDLQFDISIAYKSGMTADSALKAAAKEQLMGLISVDDYLTYDDGALTGVGGLLNWGTGEWLVAVNDFITTLSEKVQPGDTVRIMYTINRGKDVGADPASTDKGLSALTFDCGSLYPAFSKNITSYTLYVPAAYSTVTIRPTAANRRLKVFVTAGNEDASRWGARSVPVSAGTATIKVDGGRAYTVKLVSAATLPTPTPTAQNPFLDVAEGQYYYAPVLWAVNHTPQITNGTSATLFSPDAICTRGQIVTFLWRAKGCPEPQSLSNPFRDVNSGHYFYKAVLWAVEQNITNGMDAAHFAPDQHCTRAQAVTFLWRDLTGGEKALTLSAADETADPLARMMEKTPAPKCGQDDLLVFDAARNAAEEGRALPDGYAAYLAAVQSKAAATKGKMDAPDAKTLAGTVLAVTALGYNAANLGGQDLTARLNDRKFVAASGTEGLIWALLALDSGSYTSYLRADYVQDILAAQGEDGSIGSSVTATAMALQALAPYLNAPGVLRAVNSALLWLSEQQQADGGFASGDPDATAEALLASRMLAVQRANPTTAQIVSGFFSKENGTLQTRLEVFLQTDGSYPIESALRAHIAEQCKALDVMVYIVR